MFTIVICQIYAIWVSQWSISLAQIYLDIFTLHRNSSKMASVVGVTLYIFLLMALIFKKNNFFYLASGKVLVHCMMGISRSATCALAYLMINRKMSAVDAIRTMRMRRDVRPNDGFLQQLADLDNELRRERQYTYWSYSLFVKKNSLCAFIF